MSQARTRKTVINCCDLVVVRERNFLVSSFRCLWFFFSFSNYHNNMYAPLNLGVYLFIHLASFDYLFALIAKPKLRVFIRRWLVCFAFNPKKIIQEKIRIFMALFIRFKASAALAGICGGFFFFEYRTHSFTYIHLFLSFILLIRSTVIFIQKWCAEWMNKDRKIPSATRNGK